MFINFGKMDKINKSKLENIIIENASITKKDITNIELFDKFSFFNIPLELSEEVLKNLNNAVYNNRKIALEISTGRPSKKTYQNKNNDRSFGSRRNRTHKDNDKRKKTTKNRYKK